MRNVGEKRFCLLIVFLKLISASVVQDVVLKEDAVHRNTREAICRLPDGRTIEDGANFTRQETGPCVFYWCNGGNVLPKEYSCYRNGRCFPLNDVYRLGCIERTCQFFNGNFEYVLSKEACMGRDQSTCVELGARYKDGCFQYECEKHKISTLSVTYSLKQVDYGCELNGQCVPVNYTLTQGCRTRQCQKRFMNVGFYTIKDGCDINGKCVDVGNTIVDSCRTFNCTATDLNGLRVLSIQPVKIQCLDVDNNCHDSGTFFPIGINNIRRNCTCHVDGFNVEYACPSAG